jgi:UDP-N-acetylmuramate--alanine ligase
MNLFDPGDPRPVHFVGIAGAGMSALAELFARRGVGVDGCDTSPEGNRDLERAGISVLRGHSAEHLQGKRALVVSSAIPRDHPELVKARALGLRVVRRAEALGEATAGRQLLAIAGTHGKTTTTAMTADALAEAGLAPTALTGGRVAAWGGNLLPGGDELYVVEADEYDRSFLALSPTVAAITNIEADHLDIYRDLDDIRQTFAEFAGRARTIVVCGEDAEAARLRLPASAEVIRYGIDDTSARLRAEGLSRAAGGQRFAVAFDGARIAEVTLQVPGRHNVLNALASVGCSLAVGAPMDGVSRALERFVGVGRRFERVGAVGGIDIVDDYAHHPTEIAATVEAARSLAGDRRLVIAFQPHLYSRTRDFSVDFGAALARADAVYLTEIYAAREKPIEGVTSALIADAVTAAGSAVQWRGERSSLVDALAAGSREGDFVVFMGAGDIGGCAGELLHRLRPVPADE